MRACEYSNGWGTARPGRVFYVIRSNPPELLLANFLVHKMDYTLLSWLLPIEAFLIGVGRRLDSVLLPFDIPRKLRAPRVRIFCNLHFNFCSKWNNINLLITYKTVPRNDWTADEFFAWNYRRRGRCQITIKFNNANSQKAINPNICKFIIQSMQHAINSYFFSSYHNAGPCNATSLQIFIAQSKSH